MQIGSRDFEMFLCEVDNDDLLDITERLIEECIARGLAEMMDEDEENEGGLDD